MVSFCENVYSLKINKWLKNHPDEKSLFHFAITKIFGKIKSKYDVYWISYRNKFVYISLKEPGLLSREPYAVITFINKKDINEIIYIKDVKVKSIVKKLEDFSELLKQIGFKLVCSTNKREIIKEAKSHIRKMEVFSKKDILKN